MPGYSDLADRVAAEARLRAYDTSLHLCPAHQPDRWEDDGTCPICEGQRLHDQRQALLVIIDSTVCAMRASASLSVQHWADDLEARVQALREG